MSSGLPHIPSDLVLFILVQSIELSVFIYSDGWRFCFYIRKVIGDDMILKPLIRMIDNIETFK